MPGGRVRTVAVGPSSSFTVTIFMTTATGFSGSFVVYSDGVQPPL